MTQPFAPPDLIALAEVARQLGGALFVLEDARGASVLSVLSAVRARLPERAGVVLGRPSATLAQLARSLAAEFGPEGVRFNAVAIGENARVEDALAPVAFLAGPEASYITGTTLEIGAAAPATCRPAT